MKFKYQEEINEFECNLNGFVERDRQSFRWVFEDINDPRNFTPRYLLDKTLPQESCIGWALSLFISSDKAKSRLLRLTKNKEFLFKKLGTHIATGQIALQDGQSDDPNGIGHFSHFEYENITLNPKFEIIEQVAN